MLRGRKFCPSPGAVVAVLMVTHVGLLLAEIRGNFVTVDEVAHIPAGISHWETGDFGLYRVNPPLYRMVAALPVLVARPYTNYSDLDDRPGARSEGEVGSRFAEVNAARYMDLVRLARLPGVLWSLLGAWIINRWTRELYGGWAGCLAVALWLFDPTVLAFSAIVTADIPAAVAGVLATYVFWRYLQSGTWRLACLSGVLLGIAQLTKFSMLVLYLVWPLIALGHALSRRSATGRAGPVAGAVEYDSEGDAPPRDGNPPGAPLAPPQGIGRELGAGGSERRAFQALVIGLLSLGAINLGYFFRDSGRPLGTFPFVSQALTGTPSSLARGSWGNRFQRSWLGYLVVPVPADYLRGIDEQKRDFEAEWGSYLAGEWRNRGWWYYYLYALAVKEPIGTLVLVIWGLAMVLARRRCSAPLRDELTVWLPAAAIVILVSSQTGFNHHMRYILPAFPFAAVATGKLACLLRPDRRWARAAILGLVACAVASSLRVVPHSLSYFNELAGGPENGHRHLVDSNIDWGQDLLALRDWYRDHPGARPLGLALFHTVDPRLFGIDYSLPPMAPRAGPDLEADLPVVLDRLGPHPGYYAISVNFLRGMTFGASDGQGNWVWIGRHDAFTYFQQFRPIARAGYSIYIYNITPEEADAARRKMGLPPLRRPDSAPQGPARPETGMQPGHGGGPEG